jgi:hypothetical protein
MLLVVLKDWVDAAAGSVCADVMFRSRLAVLENYYLPVDLENQIGGFVEHYTNGAITRASIT